MAIQFKLANTNTGYYEFIKKSVLKILKDSRYPEIAPLLLKLPKISKNKVKMG